MHFLTLEAFRYVFKQWPHRSSKPTHAWLPQNALLQCIVLASRNDVKTVMAYLHVLLRQAQLPAWGTRTWFLASTSQATTGAPSLPYPDLVANTRLFFVRLSLGVPCQLAQYTTAQPSRSPPGPSRMCCHRLTARQMCTLITCRILKIQVAFVRTSGWRGWGKPKGRKHSGVSLLYNVTKGAGY